MLKLLGTLILLSLGCLMFRGNCAIVLQHLSSFYHLFVGYLGLIFAGGAVGQLIKQIVSLLGLTLAISFTPALAYWAFYRKKMPYLTCLISVIWLIVTTTIILLP